METPLLIIIAALLFLNAWQSWRHERTMVRLTQQSEPEHRPLRFSDLTPQQPLEEPFRLSRPPSRPPRFESYGVDVSVAPTIPVGSGRLPSFTLQGWDAPLAPERRSWYNGDIL